MRTMLGTLALALSLGGCGALIGGDMTPEQLGTIVSAITSSERSYCLQSNIQVPGTFSRKFQLSGTGLKNGRVKCSAEGELSITSTEVQAVTPLDETGPLSSGSVTVTPNLTVTPAR